MEIGLWDDGPARKISAAAEQDQTHGRQRRALTLASAVIVTLFDRWIQSHDRIYFPAVKASRTAVFPARFLGEGWICAAGLALTAASAVLLRLRLVHHLASTPVMVWFALATGMALPVALFATPTVALLFVVSALAAVCVVPVRNPPAKSAED